MKYEPLNSAGIQGGSSEYIYLVDGEEVEKVDNGEVIKVSYKVPETVDVEKVWQCKGKLLQLRLSGDGGDRGGGTYASPSPSSGC